MCRAAALLGIRNQYGVGELGDILKAGSVDIAEHLEADLEWCSRGAKPCWISGRENLGPWWTLLPSLSERPRTVSGGGSARGVEIGLTRPQ